MGWTQFDSSGSLKEIVTEAPSTLVTALPGSPTDGQEINYQSAGMATDGIIWRFRYRSASASAYKWEFIGGQAWSAEVATSQTRAATAYGDLATVGPTITAPLAGDFMLEFGASVASDTTSNGALVSPSVSGGSASSPVDADSASINVTVGAGAIYNASLSRKIRKNALTAADITLRYRCSTANTSTFASRWLAVTPIRVG